MGRALVDVVDGDAVLATLRVDGVGLAVVDALARLCLDARRRGWSVRVRDAGEDVRGLVGLAGLDGVLGGEARGEAERREQRRVEEVVQPGEPLA